MIIICGFTHIFDCNTILKREELENNINSNIDRINKYSLIKVLLSNGNKNQTNYIMMIDWELSKKISFINSVIENIFGVNIRALSNQNKNRDTFILSTICINPLLFEFEINTTLNLSPVNIHYDYEEEFGNIINIMLDKWSNYLISINKPNDTKEENNEIHDFINTNFIITKDKNDYITKEELKKWFKISKTKIDFYDFKETLIKMEVFTKRIRVEDKQPHVWIGLKFI